jgi:NitT/TauT family transport system substrate-binding protein
MPTALAQNVIEVGLGGVAPVLASVDSGAPVKLISPLHYKGDMFVVKPDFQAQTWEDFVKLVKTSDKPIRIGYKSPQAVAKVIFEDSLSHEGITFGGDLSVQGLQVQMINTQGGGKLNVALSSDIVDGYVGNNPFPSIAVEKNLGRIICDLEELPPGTFRNHPCCCIAANSKIPQEKTEAIVDLLVVLLQATETINKDIDKAVASAVHWIGTSEEVEKMSIPTSGYSMETSEQWYQTMAQWSSVMNNLDIFKGGLKGLEPENIASEAYDFSLLEKAKKKLEERRKENK